jgi:hypothetical protein
MDAAVGQSLLVFGRIDFQGSLKFFPVGIAIGIRLLSACSFALASGLFPHGLAWAGLLADAGYIATVAGFLLGGQQNLLFYVGGLALGISYPIWAIWLGRSLRQYIGKGHGLTSRCSCQDKHEALG